MVIDSNFQTPIAVAEHMVAMLPGYVKTVLEPTPGLGNIVKVLEAEGYDVIAPDDYFLRKKQFLHWIGKYDAVVGNPPFSGKTAHLEHAPEGLEKGMAVGYHILKECMEMSDNIVMLLPWFVVLDSDVRMRQLIKFGLRSVTSLPRKTFDYARIQTAIFHLEKGYTGETVFKRFEF